jgi:hypothetical protein
MKFTAVDGDGNTERRTKMEKFKVIPWRDCHGVETFFRVVNRHGDEIARFASEWHAITKAEALNELEDAKQEDNAA